MAHIDILNTIQALRAQLETLESQLSGGKVVSVPKVPATEKPKRVASDALKAWNAYVDVVKADMLATQWTHPETGKPATRKDAMQEAKRRRETDPDAYKPKPKEAPKSDDEFDPKEKPKPKRTLTDEQKAKMAAGRKAAAERRKAEKEAAAIASKPAAEKKVTFSHPPLPPSDDDEEPNDLEPLTIKAKKFLWNAETRACYKREADGTRGDWAGIYDPETKTLDTSVSESDYEMTLEDDMEDE
jgi:hypothetical protein